VSRVDGEAVITDYRAVATGVSRPLPVVAVATQRADRSKPKGGPVAAVRRMMIGDGRPPTTRSRRKWPRRTGFWPRITGLGAEQYPIGVCEKRDAAKIKTSGSSTSRSVWRYLMRSVTHTRNMKMYILIVRDTDCGGPLIVGPFDSWKSAATYGSRELHYPWYWAPLVALLPLLPLQPLSSMRWQKPKQDQIDMMPVAA